MDLVIKNGRIVDGTGAAPFTADIRVTGDTITAIGSIDPPDGAQVVDAAGRLVIPGMFDSHSHDEGGLFDEKYAHLRVVQGITSNIVGQCGATPAPNCEKYMEGLRAIYFDHTGGLKFPWEWTDVKGYLSAVERSGPSYNMEVLVGHNTLRMCVMGAEDRKPDSGELSAMKDLLDRALCDGAVGMSLGLNLLPGKYSDTEEIVELAKVLKKHDALLCSHRRGEGSIALEAIEEMLEVARRTGVRSVLSHVKVMGAHNRGKAIKALAMIESAIAGGLDISFDAYPYIEGFVQLYQLFPRWVWMSGSAKVMEYLSDPESCKKIIAEVEENPASDCYYNQSGGAKGIQVKQCPDPEFNNKTLRQISGETGVDPLKSAIDIIRRFGPGVMMLCDLQDREENYLIITHPRCMICSDGAPNQVSSHPRYLGSFARILDFYVKETGLLTLPDAVAKFTYKTARCYRVADRGAIKEGFKADLVIIDWDNFRDNSTFDAPSAKATGIDYVFVNGVLAAKDGVFIGNAAGRVIRSSDIK